MQSKRSYEAQKLFSHISIKLKTVSVVAQGLLGLQVSLKIGERFVKNISTSRLNECLVISSRLLLQLSTQAHAAETSMAFGFSVKSCRHLLEAAKQLGVQVVGLSFHIPSSCQDLQESYTHALSDARCVFDMGVGKWLLIIKLCISWNLVNRG